MKIIKASADIVYPTDFFGVLEHIERCGRVCYKSEHKITKSSAEDFVRKIIANGHLSVLEHFSVTARFVCDRGVSHEIVRHRIASYSQESTRYCDYSNDRFAGSITFIEPCFLEKGTDKYEQWAKACYVSEGTYLNFRKCGFPPQEARSVLPNAVKTELIMTANLREWRHFFRLRLSRQAHPQMREVALLLFDKMRKAIPVVFDDIEEMCLHNQSE